MPRAQEAREILPEEMANRGAIVHVVPSYKTVPPAKLPPATESAIQNGDLDVLTFASSSTVNNFAHLVGRDHFQKLAAKLVIAVIGPVTAKTLEKFGLQTQIQPQTYTIPALTEAIVDYFQTPNR
jgi:uroporphyrinogen III methyltransferase/synthase